MRGRRRPLRSGPAGLRAAGLDERRHRRGRAAADPVGHVAGVSAELDGRPRLGRPEPPGRRGSRRSRPGPRSAFFGVFGYELDPTALTDEERREVADQVAFYQVHRELFQRGRFVRLREPVRGRRQRDRLDGVAADRRRAIVGFYRELNRPYPGPRRLRLRGLDPGARLPGVASGRRPTTGSSRRTRASAAATTSWPPARPRRRALGGRAAGRLLGPGLRPRGAPARPDRRRAHQRGTSTGPGATAYPRRSAERRAGACPLRDAASRTVRGGAMPTAELSSALLERALDTYDDLASRHARRLTGGRADAALVVRGATSSPPAPGPRTGSSRSRRSSPWNA